MTWPPGQPIGSPPGWAGSDFSVPLSFAPRWGFRLSASASSLLTGKNITGPAGGRETAPFTPIHPHCSTYPQVTTRFGPEGSAASLPAWRGSGVRGLEGPVVVGGRVPSSVGCRQFRGVTQAVRGLAGGRRECFGEQVAPGFPDQDASGRTVGGAGSGCRIGPSEGEQA